MAELKPPLPKSRMTQRQLGAFRAVRRFMRRDWDPIGLGEDGPEDEYDSYALVLFGQLLRGASVADAASYLGSTETKAIGLPERPLRNVEVAAKAHTVVAELKRVEELDEWLIEWMTPKQREALAVLKKLLRHEWDPFGEEDFPEEEYDDYAPTLFSLIDRGGSVADAARYLAVVETAEMWLRERPERNAAIGAKAHAIVMAAKAVEPKPSPPETPMTQAEPSAFDSLLRLLRLEWDPTDTDGVPDDEYESFARELFARLSRGATIEEATAYLGALETLELGLPERRKRNAAIAAKAHAIVAALKTAI